MKRMLCHYPKTRQLSLWRAKAQMILACNPAVGLWNGKAKLVTRTPARQSSVELNLQLAQAHVLNLSGMVTSTNSKMMQEISSSRIQELWSLPKNPIQKGLVILQIFL